MGSETFTGTGATTWQCPPGVRTITVQVWGAGGGALDFGPDAVSGGGGGGYAKQTNVEVTPGFVYDVGAPNGGNGNGGSAWFKDENGDYVARATGGEQGVNTPRASGGSGAVGSTKYSGGQGGLRNGTTGGGGGGGGSAGSGGHGSTGGDGTSTSGGSGGSGGSGTSGNGGSGGDPSQVGSNGQTPGGGGGGSGDNATSGGHGGDGRVVITWGGVEPGGHAPSVV